MSQVPLKGFVSGLLETKFLLFGSPVTSTSCADEHPEDNDFVFWSERSMVAKRKWEKKTSAMF